MSGNVQKPLSARQEKAVILVVEDELPDDQIGEACGITVRTLTRWKTQETFKQRLREAAKSYADRILNRGIARKEKRVAALNRLHDKAMAVIEARAADPTMANAPGGNTGLLIREFKALGKDQKIVPEYRADTALMCEIRRIQESVAKLAAECNGYLERAGSGNTTLNFNVIVEEIGSPRPQNSLTAQAGRSPKLLER